MDVSVDTGTYDGGWGWGAKFFDFDNDGDLDIAAANGFISAGLGSYWYDLASWTVTGQDVTDALNWPPIGDRSFSGNEPARLWRNDGNGRFSEIAARAGVTDRHDNRGVVVFDYDNDGDLDLYLANQGAPPAFYRNDAGARRHWLALRLTGRPESGSNRDAIGARVTMETAAGRQIRELDGGNSYCGQSDRRVYFGLGSEDVVTSLEIRWPSRRVQVLHGVKANQILEVTEEASLPEVASLVPTTRAPGASRAARIGAAPTGALPPAERDTLLADIEAHVRQRPEDLALASQYRARCVRLGAHERSTHFFEKLAREKPDSRNVRLQLAAAYVDQIPTCGGRAAVVSKGILARKSLDQMNGLVDADPTWWPAVYARAMNHLHWPRSLRHSDDSARDWRRCIELQQGAGGPGAHPWYVRAWIGLGDALAKDGDFEAARAAWRQGAKIFPADTALRERLALETADQARAYVEKIRTLEEQIDTDFSFAVMP
jgi:tetratricopeptide (TPR) repeat protein